MSDWTTIGAPLDSAGEGEGEERAPAALRAAGIVAALGAEDAGDIDTRITRSERDRATGIIGFAEVVSASRELRDAVAAVDRAHRRPLILGGDCTLMIGALAGARAGGRHAGLVMVDAHLDCYDGSTSPSGECADMDLAIVIGRGPDELAGLVGEGPIVDPRHAVAVGYRAADLSAAGPGWDPVYEHELIDRRVEVISADSITDPAAVGRRLAERLGADPGRFWLHIDADAIDPSQMPAVSYPEPAGCSWEAIAALLDPLGSSPALAGASVADLNVDRDPDGSCARRLAELVVRALADR